MSVKQLINRMCETLQVQINSNHSLLKDLVKQIQNLKIDIIKLKVKISLQEPSKQKIIRRLFK